MGQQGGAEICINAKDGRLEEFGSSPDKIYIGGKWQSVALTRNKNREAQAYVNGKNSGSGYRNNSVPSPSCVCVGANIANNFGQKFEGYIAFAAIYNRVLSADEVLEIHNTLMDM
jgi:hypothetical protein